MSTLSLFSACRRASLVAVFTLVACLVARGGDVPNWAGEFTDKKFLNGLAVFQMSVERSGNGWHVAFDAVYIDGHGAAPEAEGPAKVSGNTLQFTFKDTFSNAGTGTITLAGDDIIVSIKPTHVAEARCLVFYKQSIRLNRVSKKWGGRGLRPGSTESRLTNCASTSPGRARLSRAASTEAHE